MFCICVDRIQHWAVTVCKVHPLNKVEVMPTNIQPLVNEIVVQFSCRGHSLMEESRITEVSQGDISEVLHVRPAVLPRGYVGISCRQVHERMTLSFPTPLRGIRFSWLPGLGWDWSGILGVINLFVQLQTFSSGLISLQTTTHTYIYIYMYIYIYIYIYPRLNPDHHHWRRVLIHRNKN